MQTSKPKYINYQSIIIKNNGIIWLAFLIKSKILKILNGIKDTIKNNTLILTHLGSEAYGCVAFDEKCV